MADSAIKTVVEDAGPCLKKIKVEVPSSVVDSKFTDSLATVSASVALPGFRKGRAPERLIRRRLGSELAGEARTALISEAYQQALQEHELNVVGEPSADGLEDIAFEEGKDFVFDFEVEVSPEFDLPELGGIEVKKPVIEIDDERIDGEVQKICINEGELENIDAGEPGDYLTGRGVMTDAEGTEHYNIEGAVVQLADPKVDGGKGMILGVMVDDFAKQFGSPKTGETASVKVTGPEAHEKEEIRGKELTVSFTVNSIDRIKPATVEEAAQKVGLPDAESLKNAVKARLEERVQVEVQVAQRRQISKHLTDTIDFELPERLTAAQAARNLERRRMELLYRGADAAEVEKAVAESRDAGAEATARDLKLFFILAKIANDRDVQVSEAEVNGQIARLAFEQRVRPEQLRDQLIKSGRINAMFQQLREYKTLDAILADAKVEEVSLEDFNKAFGDES